MMLPWEQVEHLLSLGYRPYECSGGMSMPGPRQTTWMRMDRWQEIERILALPPEARGPFIPPEPAPAPYRARRLHDAQADAAEAGYEAWKARQARVDAARRQADADPEPPRRQAPQPRRDTPPSRVAGSSRRLSLFAPRGDRPESAEPLF